jgi:hypothetical protein
MTDWEDETVVVDDSYLPAGVDVEDLGLAEEPVPVFASADLTRQVGLAQLDRDEGMSARLSTGVDDDLQAQSLVPVLVGSRIAGLCFVRRRRRHRGG